MTEVSINIQCTRKPGILSRLIRDIKLFGLIYSGHNIQFKGELCMITINGNGHLNCSREDLVQALSGFSGVHSVTDITFTKNTSKTAFHNTREPIIDQIDAQQVLSPDILLIAEKRLSETLGPVTAYLVENAAQNCHNCGDLFNALASELNTRQERLDFLSILN